MKTWFLLLAFGLITAIPVMASPHVYSDKQFSSQRQVVENALLAVNVNDSSWSIFVISENDWKAVLRPGQRGHTAFTLPGKLTYVNAKWIENTHDPYQIARILAHEYGHILCGCADEGVAEGYVSTVFHQR